MRSYCDNDACDLVDDIIETHDDDGDHDGNYHNDDPPANGVAVVVVANGGGSNDGIANAITQSYNNKMTTNRNGRLNPVSSTYSDDIPPSHPHTNEDNQNTKLNINDNDDNNKSNNNSQKSDTNQTAFKDDPAYCFGRNFV